MNKETVDNQEPEKLVQPVIRMDYCSDGCTSCGEECAHNTNLTKSFFAWLKSKFSRRGGDQV